MRQDIRHTGSAAGEEAYAITANLDKNVQITATFTRPADAPGFKYGQGDKGGFSYLGKDKTDGFVIQYVPRHISVGYVRTRRWSRLTSQPLPPPRADRWDARA